MPCAHCVATDKLFDPKLARRELAKLQKKGPSPSTRLLIDALPRGSLLDIGGGVGAIQQAFVSTQQPITHVDASKAYVQVAKEELERLGHHDSKHVFGDFVTLAPELDAHDVVTLDRVLCCYPHLDELVNASMSKADRAWGVVFPKDRWWTRAGIAVLNLGMLLWRSDYRAFVHPEQRITELATSAGFTRSSASSTWLWQVWVFSR